MNHISKFELNQEIVTRLNIINFSLKPSSLEKQLLDIVYEMEAPDKYNDHSKKVQDITQNKNELNDKESKILQMLIENNEFLKDKEFKIELDICKNMSNKIHDSNIQFENQNKS